MKRVLLMALFVLQACSETGLVPASGGPLVIPRTIVNCTTAQCRTNATAPLINILITRSSCADPLFGGVVSTSTRAINCTSTLGCYGDVNGWVDANGNQTTEIPAGVYNVCGCINYSATGTPYVNCNTRAELINVMIPPTGGILWIQNAAWRD